jgi:hypothetical protein
MTKANDPQSDRMTRKQLQAVISHFTGMIVSCSLLMWSVFNFWLNVLAFRANDKPDQAWGTTAVMVLITCVIPFLIGLWLLFRTLGKEKK